MVFLKAMPGINKYLDCLFSLDNTCENYMIDKLCSRGYSIGMMKEAVWLHFENMLLHNFISPRCGSKREYKKQNLIKLN